MKISIAQIDEKIETLDYVIKEFNKTNAVENFYKKFELINDDNYKPVLKNLANEEQFIFVIEKYYGQIDAFRLYREYYYESITLNEILNNLEKSFNHIYEINFPIDELVHMIFNDENNFKLLKESKKVNFQFSHFAKTMYMERFVNNKKLHSLIGKINTFKFCNGDLDELKYL